MSTQKLTALQNITVLSSSARCQPGSSSVNRRSSPPLAKSMSPTSVNTSPAARVHEASRRLERQQCVHTKRLSALRVGLIAKSLPA